MTITVATVISAIKRHLSTIGKRMYTKDGKNMFSDITLSSAEDTNLLSQYINDSVQDIEAMLKQFITSSSYGATINITILNTRGDTDFEARTQALSESYITLNSVGEYLSMIHPDMAEKYHNDARQRMASLVEYVIYKNPPMASTYSYSDVTGEISEQETN